MRTTNLEGLSCSRTLVCKGNACHTNRDALSERESAKRILGTPGKRFPRSVFSREHSHDAAVVLNLKLTSFFQLGLPEYDRKCNLSSQISVGR